MLLKKKKKKPDRRIGNMIVTGTVDALPQFDPFHTIRPIRTMRTFKIRSAPTSDDVRPWATRDFFRLRFTAGTQLCPETVTAEPERTARTMKYSWVPPAATNRILFGEV
jgi:hypothetical protein